MGKDPRGAIVKALLHTEKPIGLYRIAKTAGIQIQSADYWVHQLLKYGVVVSDDTGEQKAYLLQPLFYDPAFVRKFDRAFNSLYELVEKKLMLADQNRKDATFETLLSILCLIYNEQVIKKLD